MKNKRFSILITLFLTLGFSVQSQEGESLFTIDNAGIYPKEFLRIYKKNLDLVKDDSQKDVDNYLDLFINYKLKLKEAYELKLHEDPSYVQELKNYRSQLVKNFLTDNKVTDALVREAYNNVTNEVKASHILIRLQEQDTDTIDTYNQIMKLRERFINEDFSVLQSELHNGSTIFVEDLGYFSGFKMVYDFEKVAFNTNVGEVSQPFKSQYGYHVVKVFEKRPSRGEVKVAHIMVSKKQNDTLENSEKRINDIYKKLNQGESFESLAKQFSDDKSSASKGGELAAFKSGQLSSIVFENMAFSLDKGDISKPFETQYGWHIVKSIDKIGNPTFEEIRSELEVKVKRDSRSKLINTSLVSKLKKQYNVTTVKPDLSYFVEIVDSTFYKRVWKPSETVPNKILVKIENKDFVYQDFINHILRAQRRYKGQEPIYKLVDRLYVEFLDASVKSYHEDNLENVNEEFAQVVGEYRDGLLLFDLMEDKIWNAAKNDSVALQAFYDKNKSNYIWEERADGVIASASKESEVLKVKKQLEAGITIEELEETISNDEKIDVIFTKDLFTADHQLLKPGFQFKKGLSDIYEHNNAYHIVLVDAILPRAEKTLEEARGFVVTDFQDALEKKWLKDLRSKYKISINKDALKQIKETLKK